MDTESPLTSEGEDSAEDCSQESEEAADLRAAGPRSPPEDAGAAPRPTSKRHRPLPRGPPAKKPRWDQKKARASAPGKPARTYRSWRRYKAAILESLVAGGRSPAFSRRYMLFCKGVNVPKGIIHYYNSRYYSQNALQDLDP